MFGFAILSKPSAVVLPAVWGAIDLLLLRAAWRATAWRVMPMLVVSVGWTIFTKRLQPAETFTAIALWERFIVAGDAVAFYCRKLIFPAGLAFDYGRSPQHVLGAGTAYLTCAAAAGVFGVLAIFRARIKIVFASVVIGLIFVSPVLGFIPFHMQRYSTVADHYLYSAMLGLAVAMCGVMARFRRVVPVVLCSAVVLSILSHRQSRVWRDSDSLYTQGWAVNAQSFASANGLAGEALLRGDLESARLWSDRSLAINGQNVPAIATRAAIDIRAGDIASARKRLEYALRLAPRDLRILGMLRAIDRPQDR